MTSHTNSLPALIIYLSAMLMAVSCSSDKDTDTTQSQEEQTPLVTIANVNATDVPQAGEYTATIEAFKTNNISSSNPNRIKNILVDVGSHVSRGQRVAILDDANIDQLKVRLDNTKRDYERARKLFEIGGGTQQAVDQLKTEYDAAERQYHNMVENTILTSPVSGVVTARNYDPGDMTGTLPILTIEQVKPLKVIVNISESEFSHVKKGMKVDISLDALPSENIVGEVSLIHPTIDPSSRTFTTEITIPNTAGQVIPGMFARVHINFGHAMRVVIPDRAIVKQPGSGNRYVYIYHPDTKTVTYNKVTLGQRLGDSYEIIDGVPDNAIVVTSGQSRLADGVKVDIANNKTTSPTDSTK